MKQLRKYSVLALLLFCCYYCGISMFAHTHIVHGSSVVHSHLGGGAEHDHDDSQYAVIDILSNFQSECAVGYISTEVPFVLLSDFYAECQAPSVLNGTSLLLSLRGPPMA